ncbi:transposase [Paraphaeosphaeria sporulosa]
MDRASQVLAEGFPVDLPQTWAARSEYAGVPLTTLYYRARGRPSEKEKAQHQQYLTPAEEKALVAFLLLMSKLGYLVRIKYIPSLALTLARQRSPTAKPPGKNWPRAFEKRHPELKARTVKAIDWKRHGNNTYPKIVEWFEVGTTCAGAGVKRTMVTAIECISSDGRSLLPLIIWPASTHRSNWTTYPTPGWHYGHSENGYADSKISLERLTRVFDPQTRERANGRPRVLICDGFGTHETLEILEFCFKANILLCRLPSHTSHKLQPCDVAVFAPLKAAYRDEVERLLRGGLDNVGKEHFTSLYKPAREKAFSKRNITASWAATGLFPFNPERVLRSMPRPLPELTLSNLNEESRPQVEALRTPVTPVTTEGLTSLHQLIQRDAHALSDESGKLRLQRHVQKLANAAQVSLAKQVLLEDQNQFLSKLNKEAKVRRSTRSVVLGKAKVMSYEDLDEARKKRAEKENAKATAGKGKRGRKRKCPESEPNAGQGQEVEAGLSVAVRKARATCLSDGMEPAKAPELWRAPVARMY